MGISYGGISQLFTAQTHPPSLAAISPLSVHRRRRRRRSTRAASSTPASPSPGPRSAITTPSRRRPTAARPWAYKRIQEGDQTCEANQALHPEAVDLHGEDPRQRPLRARGRRPARRRSRSSTRSTCRCSWPASGPTSRPAGTARPWPSTSPARAASGSRSPTAPTSTRSTPRRSTAGTTSSSSTSPSRRRSRNSAVIRPAAPVIYQEAMGITGVTLPPDPIQLQPTYDGALAAFEQLPPVRVLFDNGAGGSQPGPADPRLRALVRRASRSRAPTARSWYLSPGGALARHPARRARRRLVHLGRPRPAADRLHRRHRGGRRTACGRRRRPTSGRRTRPAARPRT